MIALNLGRSSWEELIILAVLNLTIPEHEVSLHLLSSSFFLLIRIVQFSSKILNIVVFISKIFLFFLVLM